MPGWFLLETWAVVVGWCQDSGALVDAKRGVVFPGGAEVELPPKEGWLPRKGTLKEPRLAV